MSQIEHSEIFTRAAGSLTAELVAVSRARHHLLGQSPLVFDDPYAMQMLSTKWRTILKVGLLEYLVSNFAMKKVLPVVTAHILRARFEDDVRKNLIEQQQIKQIVLLGAGFDMTAWRAGAHGNLPIFEVDVHNTQHVKQERLKKANLDVPANLHFVPIDFTKDVLGDRLAKAGMDLSLPTFISWMGTSYYINRKQVVHTLENLGKMLPSGSVICFDTLRDPATLSATALKSYQVLLDFVAKRGEPMISTCTKETLQHDLEDIGTWDIVEHVDPATQSAQYTQGRKDLPQVDPLFDFFALQRR
ncbi:MAG: class I SAM-dependent methyltransferase [Alphaproteobacteria bacterium]|nr:class I SAM-dependent methyltransferase [Alphaproteobacteria bacterium]